MVENGGKWPSKRGPISKIGSPDGCGRDAVPFAVERRYDFRELGCHMGNVGSGGTADWDFLLHLLDMGRETATVWLKRNGRRIGFESTMDIERYL